MDKYADSVYKIKRCNVLESVEFLRATNVVRRLHYVIYMRVTFAIDIIKYLRFV